MPPGRSHGSSNTGNRMTGRPYRRAGGEADPTLGSGSAGDCGRWPDRPATSEGHGAGRTRPWGAEVVIRLPGAWPDMAIPEEVPMVPGTS
jgi:hypothetical protein